MILDIWKVFRWLMMIWAQFQSLAFPPHVLPIPRRQRRLRSRQRYFGVKTVLVQQTSETKDKWLSGWWFQSLWKILVSSDYYCIPNIWKHKIHVPNHQPDVKLLNTCRILQDNPQILWIVIAPLTGVCLTFMASFKILRVHWGYDVSILISLRNLRLRFPRYHGERFDSSRCHYVKYPIYINIIH